MLCGYVSHAQVNYPVKNNKACRVVIIYEIAVGPGVCQMGTVSIPPGGTVLIGTSASCVPPQSDVHILIATIGSYSLPTPVSSVGDPATIINSTGVSVTGTVPAGNPCSGTWTLIWSPTITTIN